MLSIILPTRNKPLHLRRCLLFYVQENLKFKIFIADSSSSEYREKVRREIDGFSQKLDIDYKEYKEEDMPNDKIYFTLQNISTKYSVIAADDDFHIPETLNMGVEFLENNSNYSAVHGEAIFFKMKDQKVFGEIESVYDYSFGKLRSIEDENPIDRITNYLKNPSTTWMSIQRTHNLLKNYELASSEKLGIMTFGEAFPSLMSYVQGKTKVLGNKLFIARESGSEKHYDKYKYNDWFSHITDEKWVSDFNFTIKNLIKEIGSENNTITREKAIDLLHKEYMYLFYNNLEKDINRLYIKTSKDSIKVKLINKLKSYRFIKKYWYKYNTKKSGVLTHYKEEFESIQKIIEKTSK